jgi:ribosomal protein L11 methyltransferase
MKWMELSINTNHEGVDLVSNLLYEVGVIGVVIEDPEDIKTLMADKDRWDYIDFDLFRLEGDDVTVKGYLPFDGTLHDKLEMLKESLQTLSKENDNLGDLELATGEVEDQDWAENWKKYYKPLKIGQNIVIKPSWEDYEEKEGDIVIVLDPGMAFGTGTHETTSLCIQLLERFVKGGHRVLDIGCGSGILAVTAAKLGAGSVEAYDIQEMAVDIAAENVRKNRVANTVKVERGDLFERVTGKADIVVSNIIADIIIKMTANVKEYLKSGGIFIASGIIKDRIEEVITVMEQNNLEIVEKLILNGWGALASRARG